ncbi:MAG: exosortase A [Rubrivivax sp.]
MSAVMFEGLPARRWHFGAYVFVVAALLWLFRDTALSMVAIWERSATFAHAFLVPPIAGWLVWRCRDRLARAPLRALPWMLLPMAAACALWVAGELVSVSAASQFALVALIVLSVPALFGWTFTRLIVFPLGFLFFAVPMGEFLVPTLIDHTANFTVSALRSSGIPVYRDGNVFIIPSGSWSVVEACSGVRYLIASLMVGSLFAYLNYRTMWRRWAFVGVSLVVPIVANWLRAYMIVMIGHLSGNTLAVGVDHIIYGWVFFGVVVGLMFWIGSLWAEPDEPSTEPQDRPMAGAAAPASARWLTAAGVVALAAGAHLLLGKVDSSLPVAVPVLAWPERAAASSELPFTPGFRNPIAQSAAAMQEGDRPVWVWIGYYRQQGLDRKLVSSVNQTVDPEDRRWTRVDSRRQEVDVGLPLDVLSGTLRETTRIGGASGERLHYWQWYWVDGQFEVSDVRAKLRQAWQQLAGRGDDGAVMIVVTPADPDADKTLSSFVAPRLEGWRRWLGSVRAAGQAP